MLLGFGALPFHGLLPFGTWDILIRPPKTAPKMIPLAKSLADISGSPKAMWLPTLKTVCETAAPAAPPAAPARKPPAPAAPPPAAVKAAGPTIPANAPAAAPIPKAVNPLALN
eukprot:g32993.t1